MSNYTKYKPYPTVKMDKRDWVDNEIIKAPIWSSSCLRDGNQALANPMSIDQKVRYFKLLMKLGIKEVEIAYPSASQIEFDFCQKLINDGLIPDGVTVGILTPSIEKHIKRSFEALNGAKRINIHLYNPTAQNQRDLVFKKSKEEILALAIAGTKVVKECAQNFDGEVVFEYSPESFSQTELDYALEVSNAVIKEWDPTPEHKMILNLPNTLEACMPNVYADRVEWIGKRLFKRDCVLISVHPHNDRGTAVASAEMAVLAGADRVEGTLLGNGERAGNVDLVTLAFNMHSHGINTHLNLEHIDEILKEVCEITCMDIHPRHPFVGSAIYTAYSGTHQDAIKKGMEHRKSTSEHAWNVPYLPIDPKDLKREYKDLIKINSQSGKGGVAYVLKEFYGVDLDVDMQIKIATESKKLADSFGRELKSDEIFDLYKKLAAQG